ncbi:transposase, partial [Rhizobium sp. 2YAF20]
IYRIETTARDENPYDGQTKADCIHRFRQQHSLPVLNALKTWLDDIAPKVVPDTKLGDAVSYTLNQWDYLTRYTSDGRMPIDNNILERDIRVFARRVSLCTPSLSDCKYWKGTAVNIATRAACSGDRRLYRLRRQIGGPYLVRNSRDNLLSRKDASLDKVAYHVV